MRKLIAQKLDDSGTTYMRESFVEGLYVGSQCLRAESLLGFVWTCCVGVHCTSEAYKYSIRRAIVKAAAMTSCSTAILAAKSVLQIVPIASKGLLAFCRRFMSKW